MVLTYKIIPENSDNSYIAPDYSIIQLGMRGLGCFCLEVFIYNQTIRIQALFVPNWEGI